MLSFIVFLILIVIPFLILIAMFLGSREFDKKIKSLEEEEKTLKDIVIFVQLEQETQTSHSTCQESAPADSENPEPSTEKEIPSPVEDGSCNVVASLRPRADEPLTTPPCFRFSPSPDKP